MRPSRLSLISGALVVLIAGVAIVLSMRSSATITPSGPAVLVSRAVDDLRESGGYKTTWIFDVNGDWNAIKGTEIPAEGRYFWYQSLEVGQGQKLISVHDEMWIQGAPFTDVDHWMSVPREALHEQPGFYLISPLQAAEEMIHSATAWRTTEAGIEATVDLANADLPKLGVSKQAYASLSNASAARVEFEFDDDRKLRRFTISFNQPDRVIDLAVEFADYGSPLDFQAPDPSDVIPYSTPG